MKSVYACYTKSSKSLNKENIMQLKKFTLSYQEASDTFKIAELIEKKYLNIQSTSRILRENNVIYGTEIEENMKLRTQLSDNIYPPLDLIHRNPNSINLIEDNEISISDLANASLQEDHKRLKNLITKTLIDSFKEQNKAKKYDNEEIDKLYDHFSSLSLNKSFQMYENIHEAKKNRKFLDKDNIIDKIKILSDIHKKPLLEEIHTFEVKNYGSSEIKIETPKNNGIKLG